MKKENILILKTVKLLILIAFYYIVGTNNILPYVLALSLSEIFCACFNHITIKPSLEKETDPKNKQKIFHITLLITGIISLILLILSILVSDIVSTLLNIENIFLIFLFMGLSIFTFPALKLLTEYLENIKTNRFATIIKNLYYFLEYSLFIIISVLSIRVFKLNINVALSLLFLSKIISIIAVYTLVSLLLRHKAKNLAKENMKLSINLKEEIKKILTKQNYISIIDIVKKSYYYISIIVLYLVLTTSYGYATSEICRELTFIYLFLSSLIEYLIYLTKIIIEKVYQSSSPLEKVYQTFKVLLTQAIIITITSPLICKIIFSSSNDSLYLIMFSFMAIFISIYNLTYSYILNKKIIYISLLTGLISKIILIVPLINAFYRMGYNLINGDFLSTIISMLLSIIINYIYLFHTQKQSSNYLDKYLSTINENIILCIILIICQFVIPIKTDNYLKTILLLIVYLFISFSFIKIKNQKRG